MRSYIKILEDAELNASQRDRDFMDLADQQRGDPEIAMVRAQFILGGGVLSWCIEHVGDLTHRMTEWPERGNFGYEFVKPKVQRAIRVLSSRYVSRKTGGTGFQEEHMENMRSNAEHKEPPIELDVQLEKVRKTLLKYAELHSRLPVYNKAQELARDAAVYLGKQDWVKSLNCLEQLDQWLVDPETWESHAGQYDPNY